MENKTAIETCRMPIERADRLAEQGDPASLAAAVEAYHEAIGLAAVPEDRPEEALRIDRAEGETKARGGSALALLQRDDPMGTQDSADEGLDQLRAMESYGLYTLRPLRESLFARYTSKFAIPPDPVAAGGRSHGQPPTACQETRSCLRR